MHAPPCDADWSVSTIGRPPNWNPSAERRSALLAFEGYGSAAPAVVFVGIDEHCEAGDVHQRDNVYLRCTSPVFTARRASKRDALTLLYPGLRCEEVKVWRIAAAVMHELRPALGGAQSSVARELENLGELGGDSC